MTVFSHLRVSLMLALATAFGARARPRATAVLDIAQPPKTIAFCGDSITHAGAYHQQCQLFLVTRYPGRDLWTRNHGHAGERAEGALKRNLVAIDFAPDPPDVTFVQFERKNCSGAYGF